jgi:hypothetical protein
MSADLCNTTCRPQVVGLVQTCEACPSQWEGRTADGRFVYIRYRWGLLTAGIGATRVEAIEDEFFSEHLEGGLDGAMSVAEMRHHLSPVLAFVGRAA